MALVRRERTGVQGVLTQRHQARSLRADLLGARLLTSVTYEGRDVTAGRSGWGDRKWMQVTRFMTFSVSPSLYRNDEG